MSCTIRHFARPHKKRFLVSTLDLQDFFLVQTPLEAYARIYRERASSYLERGWWGQCLVNSRKRVGCSLALVVSVMLFSPTDTGAVGVRLPNQDPEGIARGNAFVATADNPSAIYYNPAGISQLEGDQFNVGIYFISASTKFTSPSGATAKTDSKVQGVPQLYYVHALKNTPLTIGLGVYSPYGLSLDWGTYPPFDPIARKGKLLYATVNPVIAWRVHPTFSVAIGPTLNYSDAELENSSFNFKGSDVGFGYKAGLLWQPHQKWSFGANYHSATDLNYSGHSEVTAFALGRASTKAELHFPQFVTVGVSFRPTTNWNFEFDLDWTDWDSVDKTVFRRADGVAFPFLFNYESSFMYNFGITRQLGKGWSASVGYIFAENSSPDRYFNPIVPDSNLHLGSIGFAHRGKRWNWAVGYHFAYNAEREITNNIDPLANGTYRTLNQAINVSTTLKF